MTIGNQDNDIRVKLTDEDKEHIKLIWNSGKGQSINQIAKDYAVSKRSIQFILFPERIQTMRANRNWRKYYSKEKNREYARKHRLHKKILYEQGLLKQQKEDNK